MMGMKLRKMMIVAVACLMAGTTYAQSVRETIRLDEGWKFALGNAADPAKDFGCGTEYFNYLTKANSLHNEGLRSRSLYSLRKPLRSRLSTMLLIRRTGSFSAMSLSILCGKSIV